MQKSALIELQYFPPISYFLTTCRHETILLEQQENYQKASFRNRCQIAGPNGSMRLSIYLQKGKNEQQSIRDVKISYKEPWHKQHWQSIQTAYGNAPFFEFYAEPFKAILHKKHPFLFDLNYDLLNTICSQLSLNVNLNLTQTYISNNQAKQASFSDLIDYRNIITPKTIHKFEIKKYPQVFEDRNGFLPNLSILDLLFCMGPEANLYLTS